MKIRIYTYCLFIFSLFIINSYSQQRNAIGVIGESGFLISHRGNMTHLIQDHSYSTLVYYEKPSSGKKDWENNYNLPVWGVGGLFSYLGSPDYLGYQISLFPYFGFSHIRKKHFKWRTKIGTGISLVTKPFNQSNNTKNIAVGSYLNGFVRLQTEFTYRVKNSDFSFGVFFNHASNGTTNIPNLGINVTGLSLGYRYQFNEPSEFIKRNEVNTPIDKKIHLFAYLTGGVKEVPPSGAYPKQGSVTLTVSTTKKLDYKSKVGIGTDVFYNHSHKIYLDEDENVELKNNAEMIQVGAHLAYELEIAKVDFLFNYGFYLFNKFKFDGLMYHRIGLRYRFNKRLIGNFSLKSHFGKADHFEFGIGYRIF